MCRINAAIEDSLTVDPTLFSGMVGLAGVRASLGPHGARGGHGHDLLAGLTGGHAAPRQHLHHAGPQGMYA